MFFFLLRRMYTRVAGHDEDFAAASRSAESRSFREFFTVTEGLAAVTYVFR